ncbi:MAG: phospholipid/glycerol acyltransferase [Bacteroidetes bacterium]|nr:MAG: phospholipid/glycerol acyltransferase [Bacteroidota bacterium]
MWVVLLLGFGLLAAMASRISFEEDISRMLQMDSKTREYRKLIQNTHLVDKLVICISDHSPSGSPAEVKMAYCDSLVGRLKTIDTSLIRKITHTPDNFPYFDVYEALLRNLPFFMEEKDYAGFDSVFNPDNMQRHLIQKTKQLSSLTGIMIQRTLPLDPVGISDPVTLRLRKLGDATGYEIINGYFFTKDRKNLVLFVEPANPANETGKNTRLIRAIEGFIEELSQHESFSDTECSYYGATAMSVGNARQIQRDTIITLGVMCFVLILLITSVFRRKRTPFIIFLPVAFGLVFSLACISLIEKNISLIAIGATSVLLAIAVNYPIHILTHRLQENNLRKVIGDLVEPMTIGSATTIGGFICLLFVKAEILHDFGLLGAFGLIGAVIFSLVFMPHLIGRQEGNVSGRWLERTSNIRFESNPFLIWTVILLTPVFLYFSQFIQFDSDLMHLNYVSPQLEKTEKILRGNETRKHPVYVISYGKNFEGAVASAGNIKRLSDSLSRSGLDIRYTGVGDFLISEKEQKIRLNRWRNYFTKEKIAEIQTNLIASGNSAGFKESAFRNFYTTLSAPSESIESVDYELLKNVFGKETVSVNKDLTTIVSVMSIPAGSRPEIEKLLGFQPDARMLDNKYLSSQLAAIITDDFNFIALFTSLLVFVALLLTYGRIELALAAFLPMVVSWIWILGLMGLFNIQFNIVNIILSTFIFGLGDDYCIFTMDGLLQGYRNNKKQLPVIRMGIVLSGLTAFIGFGVMIIARHPALQSIALVSVIGISSVLVISQVLIPLIFNTFVTKPVSKGYTPVTLAAFIRTIPAYILAGVFLLILSFAGFILPVINISGKRHGRRLFNLMLAKAASILLFFLRPVRRIYADPGNQGLPAGIAVVAGEHSFTGMLAVLSLGPSVIIYADKNRQKLPLPCFLSRWAGHCYTADIDDLNIDIIQHSISVGQTVVIMTGYPATADGIEISVTPRIAELARKFNMDIIPVLIHNGSNCPVGFTATTDILTIKVLESLRLPELSDRTVNDRLSETLLQLYSNEMHRLTEDLATPGNCKKRLISSYIFKGPGIERAMRSVLKTENNFGAINALVPARGNVVVTGSGYGFLPFMLACYSPHRVVTGYEADAEKHEIAVNGYNRPANLFFRHEIIEKDPLVPARCLILCNLLNAGIGQDKYPLIDGYVSTVGPEGTLIIYNTLSGNIRQNLLFHMLSPLLQLFPEYARKRSEQCKLPTAELAAILEKLGFVPVPGNQESEKTERILIYKRKPV